jgi:hypothetical protein
MCVVHPRLLLLHTFITPTHSLKFKVCFWAAMREFKKTVLLPIR